MGGKEGNNSSAGDDGSFDGITASPCNFLTGELSRIYRASRLLAISDIAANGLLTGKFGSESGFIGVNLNSDSFAFFFGDWGVEGEEGERRVERVGRGRTGEGGSDSFVKTNF